MSQEKRRAIASLGGKAGHAMGKAHTWTHEEARAAGRKGGLRRSRPHPKNEQRRSPLQRRIMCIVGLCCV